MCGPILSVFVSPDVTSEDVAGNPEPADKPPEGTKPAKPSGFAARIAPATKAQLDKITSGLNSGITVDRAVAWMVKSEAYVNVYFVVACLHDSEGGSDIGAWSCSGAPDAGGGMVMSANDIAVRFSVWPDMSKTNAASFEGDVECRNLLDYARDQK